VLFRSSLNGKVHTLWLNGGDMPSGTAPGETGFLSIGEIQVVADVTAST